MKIDTPQFRTKLLRKLKNLFPTCELEFQVTERGGIKYRLIDSQGNYRSNIVNIYRPRKSILETSDIIWGIKSAGIPHHGFPKGFEKYY